MHAVRPLVERSVLFDSLQIGNVGAKRLDQGSDNGGVVAQVIAQSNEFLVGENLHNVREGLLEGVLG